MVGIPGSGKSTLAKEMSESDPRRVVVSSDEIRLAMLDFDRTGVQFDPEIEPEVWRRVKENLRACLDDNQTVECILDATNVEKTRRREFLEMATELGVKTRAVFIPTRPDRAKRWNSRRKRNVPDEVIDRMYERLEPPSPAEFDEVLVVDPERGVVEEIHPKKRKEARKRRENATVAS